MTINETMDMLVRTALNAGSRIDISLTPKDWGGSEDSDDDTIHSDLPVSEGEGRQTFVIGGHEIEYRLIPHGPVITCVPTTVWPDRVPFDKDNGNKWADSSLRYWLNHDFWLDNMPNELKRRIIATKHDGVQDLVWIPSEAEVYGTAIWSNKELATGEVRLFDSKEARKLKDTDGNERWWWTRSAISGSAGSVPRVYSDGTAGDYYADGTYGAALPCFNLDREVE